MGKLGSEDMREVWNSEKVIDRGNKFKVLMGLKGVMVNFIRQFDWATGCFLFP